MTTVISPDSFPSIVYNRSGVAIVSLTAGAMSGEQPVGNDGVAITRYSSTTIALVTTGNGTGGHTESVVLLPSDAEIGDVVEIYVASTDSQANVFPVVGESINLLPASTGTDHVSFSAVQPSNGRIYRKVSSTNWQGTAGGNGGF